MNPPTSKLLSILVIVYCVGFLTGCASTKPDTSTFQTLPLISNNEVMNNIQVYAMGPYGLVTIGGDAIGRTYAVFEGVIVWTIEFTTVTKSFSIHYANTSTKQIITEAQARIMVQMYLERIQRYQTPEQEKMTRGII